MKKKRENRKKPTLDPDTGVIRYRLFKKLIFIFQKNR